MTDIHDIKDGEVEDHSIFQKENVVSKTQIIQDLALPIETRIQAFLEMDYNELEDSVGIIKYMYRLSNVSSMLNYILEICHQTEIDMFIRLQICYTIVYSICHMTQGYKLLNELCQEMIHEATNIDKMCMVEAIQELMNSTLYPDDSVEYFKKWIEYLEIDEYVRYKTILNLPKHFNETKKQLIWHFKKHCGVRFNLIVNQYLIQDCNVEELKSIKEEVINIARNKDLDVEIRADYADFCLHNIQDIHVLNEMEDLLMELGGGKLATFSENSQNVHIQEIDKSAKEILAQLSQDYNHWDHEYAKDLFEANSVYYTDLSKELEYDNDIVAKSLRRISVDRTQFREFGYVLWQIFMCLNEYIQNHKFKQDLEKRLIEELIDMYNTCTSGYVTRLANVCSGFGDFSVRIAWEDEIFMNLSARLNRCMTEEKNVDDILENITTDDYSSKQVYHQFFLEHISKIKEEMYQEFTEYMDDSDWDLYFRKALLKYQGEL